jgi:serine protease Do
MKRLIGLAFASLFGGLISIGIYKIFESKPQPVTQVQPVVQDAAKNVSVNYVPGSIDFTEAARKTVNAVVHVKIRSQYSNYENPIYNFLFGRPNYQSDEMPIVAAGSGVIISSDGYIVTNNHVIEGADALEVTLDDKRTFTAKVIGSDPTTDIALIKIEGTDFPFIPWGDSDDLKVGEWVLAVGNPFNLASTVTAGIVSAKARSINIINKSTAIEAFIQTDAAVNPGNSGGALVNINGELVGINTAIASPTGTFSGYSFAVPERIAKKTVSDLMEYGTVQRAYIGVSINDVTSDEAKQNGVTSLKGVYIGSVTEDGAAQEAGLKGGDVILKINGVEVNRVSELQEQIGQYRPGQQINISVLRNNKNIDMLLTLRNVDGGTNLKKADEAITVFGAELKTLKSGDLSKFRLKGGVQIVSLSNGKLMSAGIREGFIITSINRQLVYTAQDLKAILSNTSGGVYIEGIYPNGISAYYAFGI